ncbi:MAG: single-stranded DNA-binding protein [Oscillospiraceae bacterium]|jgi:single-strand DNA-binding protein|nr:single-stranded DNA-binding protein [Oscillospiraceae bacterium]MCI1990940.1 single-stranded DNA-binding protein [Oscillospiraceae bacterium]MCI2035885.1 single-stranded DNA-binding protein [Oscillospiraceae bacterium]
MLNVAVLMGRFVADPELRHTPNGVSVTSFTVAVDRSYVRAGAERQTDFIDIVAWRSTAEFVCKYFRKGQLVAVQGSIQTRTYTDKQGTKRKAFEIVADNVHFAEPKRSGDGLGGSSNQPVKPQETAPAAHSEQPAPAYSSGDTGDFEEIPSDDDLPF